MSEKCPKCGLECVRESEICIGCLVVNERGTVLHKIDGEDCLRTQLATATARVAELEGVVAKLPKDAEGNTCIAGCELWHEQLLDFSSHPGIVRIHDCDDGYDDVNNGNAIEFYSDRENSWEYRPIGEGYSTQAAAEAAQKGQP